MRTVPNGGHAGYDDNSLDQVGMIFSRGAAGRARLAL